MGMLRPDPIRILLVEDDEDDYTIIRDQLSDLFASGSTLRWVRDFEKALEALPTGAFDVCLLDYRLGARSGIEFLEEVTRSGCQIPMIFLTGTGNYEIDYTAMKSGAADYLTKDELSATLLERSMRYAIEIRHKNEELLQSRLMAERKEAELALRESEQRYRELFEAGSDAILFIEGDTGQILGANSSASAMFGFSREELLTKRNWELSEEPEETRRKTRGALMVPGQVITVPLRYLRKKDGTVFPAELTGRSFFWRERPVFIASFRDITERRRAEDEREDLQAQLNQAQKLESVGRLAGGVAHDFNNMLGVILGHAEMALEQIDQADTLFTNLTEIRKAALRSADLTGQLLAFARRQAISPKILDLNETVEGMFKMLRRLIGEDIDLAWLPAKSIWPVRVDPGQIDQILANLCVNARDAIRGMGRVTIETGTVSLDKDFCSRHAGFLPGEFVMLAVSDSGCGMEEETLGKIFEPFFTTKGVGEGTGLGLATVYGIVTQNSGFINVYSEPGQGTTFKIYLPRAEEQTMEKSSVPLKKDLRGRETVLLVEDEEPMLALGKNILLRHGYEVLATGSPVEALGIVQSYPGPIHLLITDVIMPEMNGKDLKDKLTELRPELKTIFMSGYTANAIAHHGILYEGIDFLQKPFSVQTLLEKVRDVLSG